MAPFVEQDLHDLQLALVAENAAVGALFHDRQRIADPQLVGGQRAVAIAGTGLGHDAADAAQLAAVGHELDFGGQRDQFLERQVRPAGHARDQVVDAAADRLGARNPLRQQDVIRQLVRVGQAEA
jgi:hypothetical protein